MKIIIHGIGGRMGAEVAKLALFGVRGSEVLAGVDPYGSFDGARCVGSFDELTERADCIIDFSHHSATKGLLDYAVKTKTPVVLATTGHTEDELEAVRLASEKIAIFHAANMSLGVALLIELAKITARTMPDAEIEIIEKHHDRKLDAPSGTALAIANAIKTVRDDAFFTYGRSGQAKRTKEEIGIHAIRLGNIVGEHEVIVGTDSQTITLKHEAHTRALFAEGALAAAEFIVGKDAGIYSMPDMIKI
ncbi:MAG: 4-hydroxy-tetrahydrodipicolinate reductase [Clostridia bacterium]|nr:4-hydroxy-tetrahydrodipicolinate reductase [Clostridia bacterium]